MGKETNTSLFSTQGSAQRSANKGGFGGFFAIVQDTYHTNPELPIGLISFRPINSNPKGTSGNAFPFYQIIKSVPLKGEVVLIVPGPDAVMLGKNKSKDYYMPALNMWNHPQHGATAIDGAPALDQHFKETPDLNPMFPFPGDVVLEGRKGQSIRFSENLPGTPWSSTSKNNPTIAIVSGQYSPVEEPSFILEDINKDASSIYLLGNQSVPLEVNKSWKRGHLKSSYPDSLLPIDGYNYTGDQIVVNSGRLYLNAKTEHILLSANKIVGLLGDRVHLDAEQAIHFDAPVLRLTGESLDPKLNQRAIKGDDLVEELTRLYKRIDELTSTLGIALTALNLPADKALELQNFTNAEKRGNLEQKLLSNRVFLS